MAGAEQAAKHLNGELLLEPEPEPEDAEGGAVGPGQQETERELEGALDDIAKQLDKQTLEEKEKDDDDEGKCNIFVFLTSKMKVYEVLEIVLSTAV
ncbi:hypothetical protein UY3_16001 [Chelonia mydas]|uniref:Uncharacterized protein n=1 Tax=Chelonia mydas TaxID=8469 RepID=M7AQP3_CHEMY|nr:hypothetical protein UY3_16001 [Chelonia mydas]